MVWDDKLAARSETAYNFFYSLTIGAFIVVCLTSGQTNATAVNGFIAAYSSLLFVFSGFCILLGMVKAASAQYANLGFFSAGMQYLFLFFPFLMIMVVIMAVVVLLNKYYEKIIENKVSDYYTSFINIVSILLFIQIYVLLTEIREKTLKGFDLSKKTAQMLKLFGLLNIISVFTVQIILKYYTTDC